jgi:hypothetical protein
MPEQRAAIERVARLPRAQERSDSVVRFVERCEHAVAVHVQFAPRRSVSPRIRFVLWSREVTVTACCELLAAPSVAIRVVEVRKRLVVAVRGIDARRWGHVSDVADADSATRQLGAPPDIGDDP